MAKRGSAAVDWAIGAVVVTCITVPWGLYADRNPDGSLNEAWFAARVVITIAVTILVRAIWRRRQRRAEE